MTGDLKKRALILLGVVIAALIFLAPTLFREELKSGWDGHGYCCASSTAAYSGGASAFRTRTAHTLYSGIFDTGSCAAMVN